MSVALISIWISLYRALIFLLYTSPSSPSASSSHYDFILFNFSICYYYGFIRHNWTIGFLIFSLCRGSTSTYAVVKLYEFKEWIMTFLLCHNKNINKKRWDYKLMLYGLCCDPKWTEWDWETKPNELWTVFVCIAFRVETEMALDAHKY